MARCRVQFSSWITTSSNVKILLASYYSIEWDVNEILIFTIYRLGIRTSVLYWMQYNQSNKTYTTWEYDDSSWCNIILRYFCVLFWLSVLENWVSQNSSVSHVTVLCSICLSIPKIWSTINEAICRKLWRTINKCRGYKFLCVMVDFFLFQGIG
jgi:hypothetical protein